MTDNIHVSDGGEVSFIPGEMIDNRATELLPCPFCGGEANVIDHHNDDGSVSVGCDNDTCLGFSGLGWLYKTEAEAIAAWNTRAATTIGKVQVEIEPVLHGMLTAEQVRETIVKHGKPRFYGDWQAIADELNAELVSGTCENVAREWEKTSFARAYTSFCCSECGAHYVDAECYYAGLADKDEEQIRTNFCPNCGRRVSE